MSATIINEAFTIVGGNSPASASSPDDWCSEIEYQEVDICYIHAYLARSRSRGCCYPAAFFFGLNPSLCAKGAFPIPTDEGVSKSLPVLPLGFHYAQASTDKKCGRARQGVWAKERGKIYVAPAIQTTETVVLMWDGKKKTWDPADPIDDDPLLHEALLEHARWKHAERWDKDPQTAAAAMEAYGVAKAKLMRQCREETRVRRCEPSIARSSPGTLYYNQEQSATAVCAAGMIGDPITQIIPANTVASPKSVSDANVIAQKQAVDQAKARLVCTIAPTTYWNTPQTYVATCAQTEDAPVPDGNSVTITVPANTYSSTTSQAAANALALDAATEQANNGLSCIWWNSEQTASCPDGQTGTPVVIAAHTYSSALSQADADAKALNQANSQLSCTGGGAGDFWNTAQQTKVTITGCSGHPTCQVQIFLTVAAHYAHSSISQADANASAISQAQSFGAQLAAHYCSLNQCGNYPVNFP